MHFIPEALPESQARVYSDASHSRNGSAGSGDPPRSTGGINRHGQQETSETYDTQYYDEHPQDLQDDFYSGQQPHFAPAPEQHAFGQRDDEHWDQDTHHDALYHRRSRDEELKYVPMRQPVVTAPNDIQSHYGSHYGHDSHYSEHRSHRSGPGSILSGSSAGRGPPPSKYAPRSLVMPSPLQGQGQSLSPSYHPSVSGHGHSRSPARHTNYSNAGSRDHSRVRSSVVSGVPPSWHSQSAPPQAAVIPMNHGKRTSKAW
jgi:hypothetical protein